MPSETLNRLKKRGGGTDFFFFPPRTMEISQKVSKMCNIVRNE